MIHTKYPGANPGPAAIEVAASMPTFRHEHPVGQAFPEDRNVLFVLRESSTGAEMELRSQAAGVLQRHRDRDGVAELLAAGTRPLHEWSRWDGNLVDLPIGRAALVHVRRTWALYVLSSASQDDVGQENAFTIALTGILASLKPYALITGPFSRIVRDGFYVSAALRGVAKHVKVLECSEKTLNFGLNKRVAKQEFQELAARSASERDMVVSRLEAGLRNGFYAGRFALPSTHLPDGYVKDQQGQIAIGSAAQIRVIRDCFVMLANPTTTIRQVARHVQASGVFRPRRALYVGHNTSAPLSLNGSVALVTRLLRRVEVYESGRFQTVRYPSAPLTTSDGEANCETFVWPLPLPPGGWASPNVFLDVHSRLALLSDERDRASSTTPEKHRVQLPLLGYRWVSGVREYAIVSEPGARRRYLLLVRGFTDAAISAGIGSDAWRASRRRRWSRSEGGAMLVCSIDAGQLHASVADGLGSLDTFTFSEADTAIRSAQRGGSLDDIRQRDEIAATEQELALAKRQTAISEQLLYSVEQEGPLRDRLLRNYERQVDSEERLTASLEVLRTRPRLDPAAREWTADASPTLLALARLRRSRGGLPQAVVKALHAVLSGFTIRYDADAGEAVWTSALILPGATEGGVRVTSPVHGRVRAAPRRGTDRDQEGGVYKAVLTSLHASTTTPQIDASQLDVLRRRFHGLGISSSSLLSLLGAPQAARRIIVDHATGRPVDLGDLYAGYGNLVVSGYVTLTPGGQRSWNAPASSRQPLLDALSAQGPTKLADLGRAVVPALSVRSVDTALRDKEGTWLAPALVERVFVGASMHGGQQVRALLRTCPHCGSAVDIVLRARECPAGLLCSACLRMPVMSSPVFPDDYRRLAARPQRRSVPTARRPQWWRGLEQAVRERPHASVTVIAGMLRRSRTDVQQAADALEIGLGGNGSISALVTREQLRMEYVQRGRSLEQLADEFGVSTGTLTKRLRKEGIYKFK